MRDKKKEWIRDIRALHKKLGRRPKKRDSNRLYGASRALFGNWNRGMEAAGYKTYHHQKAKIPRLDENLAYYLGLLVTDGHIVKDGLKHYNLELYTSYEEEKDMLVKLIRELFDYKAFVWKRNTQWSGRDAYVISVFSKEVVNYFINAFGILSGNKTWGVEVPACILDSPPTLQGAFIRGAIEGDGCIRVAPPYVSLVSASKRFLPQVQTMLERWGIVTNRIYQHRSGRLYDLGVSGRKNIYKLYKLMYPTDLEYYYPRKKEKLEKSVSRFSSTW